MSACPARRRQSFVEQSVTASGFVDGRSYRMRLPCRSTPRLAAVADEAHLWTTLCLPLESHRRRRGIWVRISRETRLRGPQASSLSSQIPFESKRLGRLLHTSSGLHKIRPRAECARKNNPAGAASGETFAAAGSHAKWASAGVLEGRYWLCG
jgi:hypothetical protein